MTKKTILNIIGLLLSAIIGVFSLQWFKQVAFPSNQILVEAEFYNTSPCDENNFDFRYSIDDSYPEIIMEHVYAKSNKNHQLVTFHIPENFNAKRFEINFGKCASSKYIKRISVWHGATRKDFSIDEIVTYFETDIHTAPLIKANGFVYAEVKGLDGGIVTKAGVDVREWLHQPVIIRPYLYAALLVILLFSIWHFSVFAHFSKSSTTTWVGKLAWIDVSLIILFVLMLFSSLLFKGMNLKEVDDEQRSKKGFPKITPTSFFSYTPKLNAFLDDNFGGRSLIIAANTLIKKNIFHVSPNRNLVEFGKDDFMFFVDEGVGELTENKEPYSKAELEQFRIALMEKKEWLKLKGIEFYLMIPPISQNIYPELLPASYKVYNQTPKTVQLLNYLRATTDIKIIDLHTPMNRLKSMNRLYLKHDTHWNPSGAFIGYFSMISRIRKDFPSVGFPSTKDELTFQVADIGKGDCERLTGLPYDSLNLEVAINRREQLVSSYTDTASWVASFKAHQIPLYWKTYMHTKNKNLPKLFMYHDSYAMQLTEFFPNHFSHTTMVWNKLFNPNEIEAVKPDIVVIEALERFVPFLSLSNPIRMKRELAQHGIRIH